MKVERVFRFKDGRLVLAGTVEGCPSLIPQCLVELRVDGARRSAPFRIEGEFLHGGPRRSAGGALRAVSTGELKCLERGALPEGRWELRSCPSKAEAIQGLESRRDLGSPPGAKWPEQESTGSMTMHRHLIGLESPPDDYVPDPMTQGPVLPEGWDGDAWVDPNPRRTGYYLRAWNAHTNRVAYARGTAYESTRRALLAEVAEGTRKVEIRETSSVGTT
jgi:hypothetical protein